ncbi:MAG TPA: zf-HC2 domain-containing protein [Terracidiphilus sp.]|nr:zf-HC2 domain-containing protein [Terracidiphilus sp.]
MSNCTSMQTRFSEYLDGRLTGREMQRMTAHLDSCGACADEFRALRHNSSALAGLGAVAEPDDLVLRIRVALSQERARRRKGAFAGLSLAWKNTVGPFLLQVGAGFASAVLLLGTVTVLVGMFTQPEMAQAKGDEPLGDATAPRLLYLSSGAGTSSDQIGALAGPVVVEAYINGAGEVYDFQIVSGPNDSSTRAQVENMLVASRFEPARFFGQPVRGLAVLSFAGVSVRG